MNRLIHEDDHIYEENGSGQITGFWMSTTRFIIQFVLCLWPPVEEDDWPDCRSDCDLFQEGSCPVLRRMWRDYATGDCAMIDRYTVWPE